MQSMSFPLSVFVSSTSSLKYKAYTLQNFKQIPQIRILSKKQIFAMEVISHVLPFKTNNYVVGELINWENIPFDPMFRLTFPQKEMLNPDHFAEMAAVLQNGSSKQKIIETANKIRLELNPHPAGQLEHNIPFFEGEKLTGIQHKYKETALFFPSQGQTCHAYCSFCFRWPQFVMTNGLKFSMHQNEFLRFTQYVRQNQDISDILFTGGDPLIMKAKTLASYIDMLLIANIPNLKTIRIGTKTLGFWPYRFLTDPDAEELLALFKKVTARGIHLAFMAHFSHPQELKTFAVKEAIARIQETGAQIRTQSPLIAHINNSPELWTEMWNEQVRLGCIPYYMFIARNTGAQNHYSVPLDQALKVFQTAYKKLSGIARTVRGPIMSADPGKVHILGENVINGERVFTLQFLQGRNPDWIKQPFFAKYDKNAAWLTELKPAFGEKEFFFKKTENL